MKLEAKTEVIRVFSKIEDVSLPKKGDGYVVTRQIENDGTVIWYGINFNWKFYNGLWYKSNENKEEWNYCEFCPYEKLYKKYLDQNTSQSFKKRKSIQDIIFNNEKRITKNKQVFI